MLQCIAMQFEVVAYPYYIIKALAYLFRKPQRYTGVSFGIIRQIAKNLINSFDYGCLSIFGERYAIEIFNFTTSKNTIFLFPVEDKEYFAQFLDKYRITYSFPGVKCKIHFPYRIQERNSTNVISIQEFIAKIISELYQKQNRYDISFKTRNQTNEKKWQRKIEDCR